LDKKGLEQQELARVAKVSKSTVSKACNEKDYIPRHDVIKKLLSAIRKIDPDVRMSDFWDI